MKRNMLRFLIFSSLLAIVVLPSWSGQVKSTDNGFAVVELFTSQGCSSCPPAEEVLAKLVKSGKSNVFALAFHVDYWDNLGWKDKFSNTAYTARQRWYASTEKSDGVYTPQAIVNGNIHMVGSDEHRLIKVIDLQLKASVAKNRIIMQVKAGSGNSIEVNYEVEGIKTDVLLNVALIQRLSQTEVKAGENQGKKLGSVNVVRSFKIVPAGKGQVSFVLPADLSFKDCGVILYAQQIRSMAITGANEYLFNE
ncbi:hypothetical protein D3C87_472670 [compost metagenome]